MAAAQSGKAAAATANSCMVMPAPGTKRKQEAMLESEAGEVNCMHHGAAPAGGDAAVAANAEPEDVDQPQAAASGAASKSAARHSRENVPPAAAAAAHVNVSGSKAAGSGGATKSSAGNRAESNILSSV